MKRIYNNSDIQINLKTISGITDKFIIKFFTTNKEFFIRKTNENVYIVDDEKYIKLNWSELQTIGDGVLNYVLNNIKDDTDYDDSEYNNTISKTTNYYICSNFKVDPETDKSISEIIAELTEKVDAEITRSANKDSEHDNAISNLNDDLEIEADARGAADLALQANIDNEATARQDADTQLQNSLVENEFVVSAALNDLKSNKAEKEEINTLQSLINQLQTKIDAEETARQNADTALQTDLEEDELVISTALNDLNSNKADKQDLNTLQSNLTTEIENETTARQNADAQLQSNIDGKANIEDVYDKQTANSTFVTKAELQEILKKINGGEY